MNFSCAQKGPSVHPESLTVGVCHIWSPNLELTSDDIINSYFGGPSKGWTIRSGMAEENAEEIRK